MIPRDAGFCAHRIGADGYLKYGHEIAGID
jgi:hypothetical protein